MQKQKKKKGYTLMEVLMAVGIFALVMMLMLTTLVNLMNAKDNAKALQRDMENATFALEAMAKSIRVSELISCNNEDVVAGGECTSGDEITSLEIFNYSQSECLQYRLKDHQLEVRVTGNDLSSCSFPANDTGFVTLMDERSRIDKMYFLAEKYSQNGAESTAGKVTVAMEICTKYLEGACLESAGRFPVQTTVSLRR
jgi:prepilin-type N-terminal cleavage/methylation domain-containing protein